MGTRDTGIGSLTDSTRWSGVLRGGKGKGRVSCSGEASSASEGEDKDSQTQTQIQAEGRGGSRNVRRGEKDKKEN